MRKNIILKSISRLSIALVMAVVASGCVYSKVTSPLDTDVAETKLGDKVGRSSNHSVLWLFAWGDAGTQAAAENGGITTIRHLDKEYYFVFFGAYSRATTIAYGD